MEHGLIARALMGGFVVLYVAYGGPILGSWLITIAVLLLTLSPIVAELVFLLVSGGKRSEDKGGSSPRAGVSQKIKPPRIHESQSGALDSLVFLMFYGIMVAAAGLGVLFLASGLPAWFAWGMMGTGFLALFGSLLIRTRESLEAKQALARTSAQADPRRGGR